MGDLARITLLIMRCSGELLSFSAVEYNLYVLIVHKVSSNVEMCKMAVPA